VDQVLFAPDHAWIRLGTASGITEAAVIRRSRRGRVIDTWTLDGSINPHP
jgi:hypothetical protein